MSANLVRATAAGQVAIARAVSQAREYAAGSKADSTQRTYGRAWLRFAAWCREGGITPMPATPAVVAAYAAHRASQGCAVTTIAHAVAAIAHTHAQAGAPVPTGPAIDEVMAGIRRALRGRTPVQKLPAMADKVRAMVGAAGDDLAGLRNRALILLGFAGAMRRAELVALDVADLVDVPGGLRVHIRWSKTDQTGKGDHKGIPTGANESTCPVRAVRRWLDAAGIIDGPVFRGVTRYGRLTPHRLDGRDVARVIKRLAAAAGLDPAPYAGHSLRAGLVTEAYRAGKTTAVIMRQTGHKSVQTLHTYIRLADLFRDNAASDLL